MRMEAGGGAGGTPRAGRDAERKQKAKATTHAARAKSVSVGAKIGSNSVVDTH